MTLRCITVDDEPFSLAKINGFIARVPYLTLVASFSSAIEVLPYVKQHPVELLFLDIQMENLTGIELLEILDPKPEVILTTAHDQYALKGYELNVSDYLLKPYSFERFLKATEKVLGRLAPAPAERCMDEFIFLKTEYKLEKVRFDEILYVESRGDYIYVVTPRVKVLTLMSLKGMAEKLPLDSFVRVHKSYIVAVDKIDAIEHGRVHIRGSAIPIGDMYREKLWQRLSL
ncbi:LytTR family DNA-binding domain-containing protein [uncultured Acetobacteroides sp.]|uniref:LytR/AlgR family response regulator transcription factor n=1 Tax=uncultured Acetobacteroides sp. TaxID=1760811 RepID=UPI0029F55F26|nr:LytTR family DNA-binding domain-containing protein [uncultured Acetobacteroides sp.]